MDEEQFTPKELSTILGVTPKTLIEWEKNGKIKAIKTKGGHRRYIYNVPKQNVEEKQGYLYARVSSSKQLFDLQRQISFLKKNYPNYQVIQDIGSGINFKRKGLITLLEKVFTGQVSEIVVAHRDRLTRFGIDLFIYIFKRFEVSFKVLSNANIKEPTTELKDDILSIITVFTARYYGSRSYKIHKKNKILSKHRTIRITK